MPLTAEQIYVEQRLQAGRAAAFAANASELKHYGQTSETCYPYTYWWIRGFNDAVAELTTES